MFSLFPLPVGLTGLLEKARITIENAPVDGHVDLLRGEHSVHEVHVLLRRVVGRLNDQYAKGVLLAGGRVARQTIDVAKGLGECHGDHRARRRLTRSEILEKGLDVRFDDSVDDEQLLEHVRLGHRGIDQRFTGRIRIEKARVVTGAADHRQPMVDVEGDVGVGELNDAGEELLEVEV